MAIRQCACCGKKLDDQEDNYEALHVEVPNGTRWYYYHMNCIDDMRTREHLRKRLPKKVRAIKIEAGVMACA